MRKSLQYFVVAVLFLLAAPALAQEGESHNRGTLEGSNHEVTHTEESPAKIVKPDSAAVIQPKILVFKPKQTEKTAEKKTDESSFNFLYYIIQRFKSSDIIED
jgi:hypothetical protein